MMRKLFTERHGEGKPRLAEMLDDATREGLLTLVSARIDEEWFGLSFNEKCGDGYAFAGTDLTRLGGTMKGYGIIWPHDVDGNKPPTDGQLFDLLEFSYEFIAEAKDPSYHSYMSHSHDNYDRESGRAKFTQDGNRMFERNGMAFEMKDGEVVRLAPAVLQEALASSTFRTGDPLLDEMLEASRPKILNRSIDIRREPLEKLWDAWERLKTLEPGRDKRESAGHRAPSPQSHPTRSAAAVALRATLQLPLRQLDRSRDAALARPPRRRHVTRIAVGDTPASALHVNRRAGSRPARLSAHPAQHESSCFAFTGRGHGVRRTYR